MSIPACVQSLDLGREDERPALEWLPWTTETVPATSADPGKVDPGGGDTSGGGDNPGGSDNPGGFGGVPGPPHRYRSPPHRFWPLLFEHAGRVGPELRSRPEQTQDLYTDLIARHLAADRPAFLWMDRRGLRSLSYADLHARASACALAWAERGVVAGASIALVMPMGEKLVVALLAALRLGAVVGLLDPTLGPFALEPRVAALKPKHVVFEPDAPPALGKFADLYLPVITDGPPHRAPPYGYAPTEPCACLFSPLHDPLLEPVALPADKALENALRDAVFAYRLMPGDVLAIPGFPFEQHQPAILLSVFLSGAAFLHLSVRDIEADATIFEKTKISVLGLSPALMDSLTRRPRRLAGLRNAFRSVDEPLDWAGFQKFVDACDLRKVPMENVLVDAANGGCLLFSTRRPGSGSARALPAPGRAYALLEVGGGGKEAEGKTGVFALMTKKGPAKDGFFLLASLGEEFLYGSTLMPRRAARVFPSSEVVERAALVDGVLGAIVLPMPTPDPGARFAFVLLVFTGAKKTDPDGLRERIRGALREELGEAFVPDKIEVSPLYARQKGKELDERWCSLQYSSGTLAKKAELSVFRDLTALRGQLLGT